MAAFEPKIGLHSPLTVHEIANLQTLSQRSAGANHEEPPRRTRAEERLGSTSSSDLTHPTDAREELLLSLGDATEGDPTRVGLRLPSPSPRAELAREGTDQPEGSAALVRCSCQLGVSLVKEAVRAAPLSRCSSTLEPLS